jgi:Staphylococcal nuclease homologue
VRLEFDQDRTDRYGRTLAYVYLQPENLSLNAEIIRQGRLSPRISRGASNKVTVLPMHASLPQLISSFLTRRFTQMPTWIGIASWPAAATLSLPECRSSLGTVLLAHEPAAAR